MAASTPQYCFGFFIAFLIVLSTCAVPAADDTIPALPPGTKFPVPDSAGPLLDVKLTSLQTAERAEIAKLLGLYVRNQIGFSKQEDVDRAARLLLVALTLDPEAKHAYVAKARLAAGQVPGKAAGEESSDGKTLAKLLLTAAQATKGGKGEHDQLLAGYLAALAVQVDPTNDDAVFALGRLKDAGVKVTWGAWNTEKQPAAPDKPNLFDFGPKISGLPEQTSFGGVGREAKVVAPLPDNRYAVSGGGDGVVRLWDITTGKEIKTFGKHGKEVTIVAASRDGKMVASGGADEKVQVWQVDTGAPVATFDAPSLVTSLAFSADSQCLGAGGFHLFTIVWDLKSKKLAGYGRKDNFGGYGIAFSDDGRFFATGGMDDFLVIWDASTWKEVKRLTGGNVKSYGLAFSPDGTKLAAAQANGIVRLWDVEQGKSIYSFEGHSPVANRLHFSQDGRMIVSCGEDLTPALWDVESLKEIERVRTTSRPLTSHFIFGGRMVVIGTSDGTARTLYVRKALESKPVYLSDLTPKRVDTFRNVDWSFGTRGLVGHRAGYRIKVDGVESPNGLGTLPKDRDKAAVVYELDGKYERITGEVAIDDSADKQGASSDQIFEIRADGKSLWKSKPLRNIKIKESFDVRIKDVRELELLVHSTGSHMGAHAVWLEPRLLGGQTSVTSLVPALTKRQSTVKGIMVRKAGDGSFMGYASDVILTVEPQATSQSSGSQPVFIREPGAAMKLSMEEATRHLNVVHPIWPAGRYVFSFQDKYSPKDGGSAGAVFALLLHSVLKNVDIDPQVAVTGDVSVNGKVLQVGAAAAKLRGAIVDRSRYIVLPASNVDALSDMLLLYGSDRPWDGQVLSAATIDELVAVARVDREKKLTEGMHLFSEVQAALTQKGKAFLTNADLKEKIKRVVELAPNHESAKYLLLLADSKAPSKLTRSVSLTEAVIASAPLQVFLWENRLPAREGFTKTTSTAIDQRLRKLSRISHADVQAAVTALIDFNDAVGDLVSAKQWDRDDPRLQKLVARREKVIDAMRQISTDRAVMENLMREGN